MSECERHLSVLAHLRMLDKWLEDPGINEIAVNAPGVVQLWRAGVWERVDAPAITFAYLQTLGSFLANISRKPFDEAHPILSAHLPGGERVEMTMPPTAAQGMIYLNLRKHTSRPFALEEFVRQDFFSRTRHVFSPGLTDEDRTGLGPMLEPAQLARWRLAQGGDWQAFLSCAVRGHENILVSGATGSGKTSFVRALVELVPTWERLLTVEDTPEMPLLNHPNSQALFYRRDGQSGDRIVGATAKEVLQAVVRKTPHRVMLAELRGDETFYYVQNVLNSGHPGGITTVHANSPSEAYLRVALLIKASDEGRSLSLQEILRLLHMLVHVVVQLVFDPTSGRHVPAIYYDPMQPMLAMH